MSLPELPAPTFQDGRGLYPETLRTDVPRGLSALIKRAAALEGTSKNEFVRRAISARISMFQYAASLGDA